MGEPVPLPGRLPGPRRACPVFTPERGAGLWLWISKTLIFILFGALLPVSSSSPINIKMDSVHEQLALLEQKYPPQQIWCPSGSHLSGDSKTCVPCTSGRGYTEHWNRQPSCFRCAECRSDQKEVTPCTTTTNRKCECKEGTFSGENSPEACQACTLGCPDGMVMESPCTSHSDLKCISRDSGTSDSAVTQVPGKPLTNSGLPPSPSSGNGSIMVIIATVSIGLVFFFAVFCVLMTQSERLIEGDPRDGMSVPPTPYQVRVLCSLSEPPAHTCPQHCLQRGRCREGPPTAKVDTASLLGTSVSCNYLHRVQHCLCPKKEPGALDNARNNNLSKRDSVYTDISELEPQGQQQAELTGVTVQIAREAEPLLRSAETKESQKESRRLVPVNAADATESLRKSFDYFSSEVNVRYWDLFMRKVGLKENDIQLAKERSRCTEEHLHQMLQQWHSITGMEASVNTLLDALVEIKENLAKDKIEKHLVHSKLYTYEDGDSTLP
ncbi:PREDICTED: tumor necrosis factor receptor superfamily member 10A [Condylura cristata]|uniref:tumor necrosis factor receptor superfamily member 10A n=1 Tax=Condylura cristata TaxID=143302 RepID=UPI000642D0C0|nr:PREDICTED: tumor necrosis factor receptor superfamily member 10A [Condylura cristata]